MIAKIVKGASFRGCVQYVTGKDNATVLVSDGVLLGSVGNIADSFEYQRGLNPRCSKPVGHIALSFKPEDKEKLTDEMMAKIAREYMELMGIRDTQFILVRHHNTANPHCHLVYNRVDNNGRIISDKFERKRSEKIVKHLKDKYGLTYSDGKGQTRTERLHYTERTKFEIQNAVKTALQASRNWQQFMDGLKRLGVEVEFKRRKGSNDVIEGITFIKDGVRFKGSQIGRQFTYAKLNEKLSWDEQRQTTNLGQTRQNEQPMQEPNPDYQGTSHSTFDFPSLGLFDTNNPVYDPAEEEFLLWQATSSITADGCNGRKRSMGRDYKRSKKRVLTTNKKQENMKDEIIESIFGCLERIEEKLDKQPVQTEQGKSEDKENLAEALSPLVDSMNRTNRNLCVLRDALKIVSERQKESRKELLDTIGSKLEALSAKGAEAMAEEIRVLRQFVAEQTGKPQHKKVIHDLTTKTWWLVGIGIAFFFCMSLLATKIYDQSKEIEELQLAGWKYRALRATLPANNANVIWLERNVWAGNKDGIRHCQQFVINYEDSIRRRHEMEQRAAQNDSTAKRLMRESEKIRKDLR